MASLPYMQFYPADYLADTGHLSHIENSAYLLLIFNYWQRGESFKAKDDATLDARLANIARLSPGQWQEVKSTLSEFFEITETEWRHNRIEKDLNAAKDKSQLNQTNGKKGAETRWKKDGQAIARPCGGHNPGYSEPMAISDIRKEKISEKKNTPPISPPEGGGEGDATAPKPATHLAQEIMREYNAILAELEPAVVMSSAMSLHLKLNREGHPERGHVGFWVGLFHKARASPHLMGRLKDGNWKASLPWLLMPDNVDNILNGKYSQNKDEVKKHAIDYGSGPRPMGSRPKT